MGSQWSVSREIVSGRPVLCDMSNFHVLELGGDIWGEDDSDFDLNSCSSDSDLSEYEDNDRLCNTMLLVGPHGVGKTATVSALATELGYKVLCSELALVLK